MRWLFLAINVVLLIVITGCQTGPRMYDVSGKVTLDDGKAMADGEIYFDSVPTAEHAWGPDYARVGTAIQAGQGGAQGPYHSTLIPGTSDMYGAAHQEYYRRQVQHGPCCPQKSGR